MEISDTQRGTQMMELILSTTSWNKLQQRLAKLLNAYPTMLQLQYHFSTDSKDALPLDLGSQAHLNSLIAFIRPLIVPFLLANGCHSTKKMEPVSVQVFVKGDGLQSDNRVGDLSVTSVLANDSYRKRLELPEL
jgi:hypothetical protein